MLSGSVQKFTRAATDSRSQKYGLQKSFFLAEKGTFGDLVAALVYKPKLHIIIRRFAALSIP